MSTATPDPTVAIPAAVVDDIGPLPAKNRFQRWYFAWARKHYLRMPPATREQVIAIDRFLYSRRGLGMWFGLLGGLTGSTFGLIGAGLPWLFALCSSLFVWTLLPLGLLAAWLQPARRHSRRPGAVAGAAADAGRERHRTRRQPRVRRR